MAAMLNAAASAEKKRADNWSPQEMATLVEFVLREECILRARFNPSITAKVKAAKWQEAASVVSALGVSTRSRKNVREKWNTLFSKAKCQFHKIQAHSRGTGGGPPLGKVDPILQKIIERFEKDATFLGIGGGFEAGFSSEEVQDQDELVVPAKKLRMIEGKGSNIPFCETICES